MSSFLFTQSTRCNATARLTRDYASQFTRRSYSNRFNPGHDTTEKSANRAIWSVILINGVVFATWQYANIRNDRELRRKLTDYATISWANIKADRWITALTSAFSHQDAGHIVFNMLAFYAFGTILSYVPGIGGRRIWAICAGSAISGSLCWLQHSRTRQPTVDDRRRGPFAQHASLITSPAAQGASGMVMGIGAVATCLMPRAPMSFLFIPVPIPLWVTTLLYVGIDLLSLNQNDRIGHAAHLGGAFYGVLYYAVFLRRFGGIFAPRGRPW